MRTGPALVSNSRTHVLYTTCLLYCLLTLAHFCGSVIPAAVSGRAEQPLVSHNNNMGFADKEKFNDVRAVLAAVASEQFVGSQVQCVRSVSSVMLTLHTPNVGSCQH